MDPDFSPMCVPPGGASRPLNSHSLLEKTIILVGIYNLGGGFEYFLIFTPNLGED